MELLQRNNMNHKWIPVFAIAFAAMGLSSYVAVGIFMEMFAEQRWRSRVIADPEWNQPVSIVASRRSVEGGWRRNWNLTMNSAGETEVVFDAGDIRPLRFIVLLDTIRKIRDLAEAGSEPIVTPVRHRYGAETDEDRLTVGLSLGANRVLTLHRYGVMDVRGQHGEILSAIEAWVEREIGAAGFDGDR